MDKETQGNGVDSKEFFVDYLSKEIDQLHEDIKRPGWTIWAIVAAIASLSWLLILELEKNLYQLDQVLLLFLIISFIYSPYAAS